MFGAFVTIFAKKKDVIKLVDAESREQNAEKISQHIKAAFRTKRALQARERLMPFILHTMPDPFEIENDPLASRYKASAHHNVLAEAMEEVASGKCLRLIISVPPQFGKSEIATRRFVSWYWGKFPHKNIMHGSYSQDFADGFGSEVRNILEQPEYAQVFPKFHLQTGSKAKDHMANEDGGKLSFLGRGGAGTGKPADIFIIDDPVKDAKEAESTTIRNDIWEWFTKVAYTRCHVLSAIVIIMCMTGDTKVLMADGSYKELKYIRPDDLIASYENGKIRISKVLNWANQGSDSVYEIRTTSGIVAKANERHPFLVERNGALQWIKLRNLEIGDRVQRVTGENGAALFVDMQNAKSQQNAVDFVCDTTIKQDGLVGNAHHHTIQNRAEKRDCDIDTELVRQSTIGVLQSKMGDVQFAESSQKKMSGLTGAENSALTTAMKVEKSGDFCATTAISPSDMEKQNQPSLKLLNTYEITHDTIESISPAGQEDVFDIQVEGTENFVANGLISHNTRWHEDDLVGRLTDPTSPFYNEEVAKTWTVINIPAILDNQKLAEALGKKQGDALWPERFPLEHLNTARLMNPIGFSALYMGRPTPPEGAFYKREMLLGYEKKDLPTNMRMYGTCDLAVSPERNRDKSVIGNWGLDENDVLWLLPDLYWESKSADESVDQIWQFGKQYGWFNFWGEKGIIERALRPFLIKRMMEESVYFNIDAFPTIGNKGARSISMRGRMAQGKVRFPKFAPWWAAAQDQILKFTGSGDDKEDDFCDMMAIMGEALLMQVRAGKATTSKSNVFPIGSIGWVKEASNREKMANQQRKAMGGF